MDSKKFDFRGLILNNNESHNLKNFFLFELSSVVVLDLESNIDIGLFYSACLESRSTILFISLTSNSVNSIIDRFLPNYIISKSKFNLDNSWEIIPYDNYIIYVNIVKKKLFDQQILLSTSGSTGMQKFVRLSVENMYSNAKSIVESLNISSFDITITNLPLHYSFGLSVLNSHLLVGAKVVLTNYSIVQKEFWDLVKRFKVTTFFGVPYTFEILDKIRFYNMDLPHLRLIGQAGGKMKPLLQEKYLKYCTEKGIEYYTMYGQTEATARMSYLPFKQASFKKGSIGIPIPGGRFELRDEFNQIIEDSESEGELVYYGPNVSLGYANCSEDLSKGDENKGVLYTGDLAKKDKDDYFYIVGRKNRFLKLFGNRISLQDIEEKLQEQGIESVCGGEDDKMIIYLTDKGRIEFAKKMLSEIINIHTSAYQVKFVEKIPRNSSGKILYNKLFLK